jgi:hypothetical protein
MSDYTLPPRSALIVGMIGSGKTTFGLLALQNEAACCRFIFDDLGQASARLRRPHASTSAELEASLATQWSLFNPHRMFPGDLDGAFRFHCEWVFNCACRCPGRKVLMVDEAWRFQTPQGIPRELAMCTQAGRSEGLELMLLTQLPHKLHASVTGQATEIICFKLQEHLALDRVSELDIDPERVRTLNLGQYIARNRLTGRELTGRVF